MYWSKIAIFLHSICIQRSRRALLLFDYNGQLLEHAICLVVLFFLSLYCIVNVSLNEINGDGDGDCVGISVQPVRVGN